MKTLKYIYSPRDLAKYNLVELGVVAQDIRDTIIETVACTGGHLAPNLGVVELTLALHTSFRSPQDKIVWDVGHQCYTHKLLTGRREQFHTLRSYKGISGFPKKSESEHDVFEVGHSSTSLSAALGLALVRDLTGKKHHVIAVIGDGALTGGMAFEALNHIGDLQTNMLIVLNDNEMSISDNVGAYATYLSSLRTAPRYARTKHDVEALLQRLPTIGKPMVRSIERLKDSLKYLVVPGVLFEEIGITYLGPIDGHNIRQMQQVFHQAKSMPGPVIVHCITEKGKGYPPAEKEPCKYHGVGPFNVQTGAVQDTQSAPTYTDVFGETVVNIARKDSRIIAITAAMRDGVGLGEFAKAYPKRFFDVGIAEQHAVTLAAGLASGGLRPIVAIYSTFMQRAYDQILHDVALQNLPVIFCCDRAGLVGEDGPTHHGVFDLTFMRSIPNMTVMVPRNGAELVAMLHTAMSCKGPVVIRYPRGRVPDVGLSIPPVPLAIGKALLMAEGNDVVILAVGNMVEEALKVRKILQEKGVSVGVFDARFVKPLDKALISNLAPRHLLVTLEDNTISGGFGAAVSEQWAAESRTAPLCILGIPDRFVTQGSISQLRHELHLTPSGISRTILEKLEVAWGEHFAAIR